jgi:hypothetical protein
VAQRAQLQGDHQRQRDREPGKIYVAGVDIAGEAEVGEEAAYSMKKRKDSTVVTIGELNYMHTPIVTNQYYPKVKVVEHYQWTGKPHSELYQTLVDLLKNVWGCKRVVVDATGIGEPVASFLRHALGLKVIPFKFTQRSKSELGFNLLAAVNSGRLKVYAADSSSEYRKFWIEMEKAKSYYRPNQTVNFFVEPEEGHDDFLMSLALMLEAAEGYKKRSARGSSGSSDTN